MLLSLHEQLVADNNYFKKLISLVPLHSSSTEDADASASFGLAETSVRERLHQKIEVLKGKRTKPGKAADSIEKKRLKRKLSKAKLRQKRKAEKQQNHADVKVTNGITTSQETAKKAVFNKEGKVVFSKFEFSGDGSSKTNNKSNAPTGKNYKALLEQVEKQQQKISKVRETNPDQARVMEDKLKWKTALSKAEGVKVKDNPDLLKKSLKKREKKKEYSRRKWEERENKVSQQIKQRQEKRAKNIAKKKEGRKEKKIKLAKKRGRVVV